MILSLSLSLCDCHIFCFCFIHLSISLCLSSPHPLTLFVDSLSIKLIWHITGRNRSRLNRCQVLLPTKQHKSQWMHYVIRMQLRDKGDVWEVVNPYARYYWVHIFHIDLICLKGQKISEKEAPGMTHVWNFFNTFLLLCWRYFTLRLHFHSWNLKQKTSETILCLILIDSLKILL